jgi:L-methionine (R)-S-oxide reductase
MDVELEGWLRRYLERHGAASGTVHVVDGAVMRLAAAVNIPPAVLEQTAAIPKGKGMGGQAWELQRPVATCNLQEDASGRIRPGAKAVGAKAAMAFPIGDPARLVVGIAWMDEMDLDDAANVERISGDVADLPR